MAQLQAAMDEPMSLMYREYYAMKLVIGSKEFRYRAKSFNKMHQKLYGDGEEIK